MAADTGRSAACDSGTAAITSPEGPEVSGGHRILVGGSLSAVTRAFLSNQAIFFGAALLGASLIPPYSGGAYQTWHMDAVWFVDVSWRWDGRWYADIAAAGYRIAGDGYQNVAFFPLYPLLIRTLAEPWGAAAIPVAGALLSRVALFGALLYLYHLAELERGPAVAARAVLYVAVYPTALFFSAGYAESLFLLTSVAGFYYARRQQWWAAGAFGFLAVLTRPQGLLLLIPFGYELWRQHQEAGRRPIAALGIVLVPAGLAVFMLYLQLTVGNALAFVHAQGAWLRSFALPHETLVQALQMAVEGDQDPTRHAMGVLNTLAAVTFLLAALWSLKRQRPSYALYSLAAVVLPLLSPVPDMPTVSMARFTAVIFPVFLLLADWGRQEWFHDTLLLVSTALFALLAALFVNWYWIV